MSDAPPTVDRSAPTRAHPRGPGLMLLTAFLAAATVPALHSWISRNQERQLQARQAELDRLLQAASEGRRDALPPFEAGDAPKRSVEVPAGARRNFADALVFSPQALELFKTKGLREGEFERALKPPLSAAATAARDGIEVRWEPPADFEALSATLRELPLLRLGFRVYRWREGEEPRLVTPSTSSQTTFTDRDLPLWRVRFFYCVATVLEGTIGDLPTLIESKRSSVITVETLENFALEVTDGSADRATVKLSAWMEGEWHAATVEVASGRRITATFPRRPGVPGSALEADVGLTVQELRVVEAAVEQTVDRAEFLPDGRRKTDRATGRPTFRTETITVPTRTLEMRCSDPSGATRTFTAPLEAPHGD